jgi:hypothetical protein
MITSARIEAVKELGGIGWITCLCAPAIRKLAADDAPLQMSVLDQQDLAELSHPDYPGERLIADRNPYLAAERACMREDLLQATEKLLTAIAGQVSAGRVSGAGKIGLRARRIVNKHEVAKHLILYVGDHHLGSDGLLHVDTPVGHGAVADLDVDHVDERHRTHRVQRMGLPFGEAVEYPVGDRADRVPGDLDAVDLRQVRLDLAGGHALVIH